MTFRKSALLSCLSIHGGKKYDLPGFSVGIYNDYTVYFRPDPQIIHYSKKRIYTLENPEIVLVSLNRCHVISIALDEFNKPINMYININLMPEINNSGHHWVDLELDIKVFLDEDGNFTPILVDIDEYEKNILDPGHKEISEHEISQLIDRIFLKQFPFNRNLLDQFLNEQYILRHLK